jgi:hypothetical protein
MFPPHQPSDWDNWFKDYTHATARQDLTSQVVDQQHNMSGPDGLSVKSGMEATYRPGFAAERKAETESIHVLGVGCIAITAGGGAGGAAKELAGKLIIGTIAIGTATIVICASAQYVGNNPTATGTGNRVNSDLPGGESAARRTFDSKPFHN